MSPTAVGKKQFFLVPCSLGTDRLQFPDRGENFEEIMSRVEGISHDLSELSLRPWGVLVTKWGRLQQSPSLQTKWYAAVYLCLCQRLQEDGLSDGCVKIYHNFLWHVELLQLSQEVHILMGFWGPGWWWCPGSRRTPSDQSYTGCWRQVRLGLKSPTISTVLRAFSSRSFWLPKVTRLSFFLLSNYPHLPRISTKNKLIFLKNTILVQQCPRMRAS